MADYFIKNLQNREFKKKSNVLRNALTFDRRGNERNCNCLNSKKGDLLALMANAINAIGVELTDMYLAQCCHPHLN